MLRLTAKQIIDLWEASVANTGTSLMIKYGLPSAPSKDLIAQWVATTDALVKQGHTEEVAASSAAKVIFPGYQTHTYASQADDISSLLDAARRRDD